MLTERKLLIFVTAAFTALLIFTVVRDELACPF